MFFYSTKNPRNKLCVVIFLLTIFFSNTHIGHTANIPSSNGYVVDYAKDNPSGIIKLVDIEGADSSLPAEYAFFPQIFKETTIRSFKRGVEEIITPKTKRIFYTTNVLSNHTYIFADFVGYYQEIPISMKITPTQVVDTTSIGIDSISSLIYGDRFLSVRSTGTHPTNVPEFRYEFFHAETGEPQKVSGYFTYLDIDGNEYIGAHTDFNLQNYYVMANSLLKYNNETDIFKIRSEEYINQSETDQRYQTTLVYKETAKATVQLNSSNGSIIGAINTSLIPIEHPSPLKLALTDGENVHYKISQTLSPRETGKTDTSLRITDKLNSLIQVKSIKIYDNVKKDITSYFNVTLDENNQLVCSAKPEWLKNKSNYGQTIELDIQTTLDQSKNYESYYQKEANQIVIPNKATISTSSSGEKQTNKVAGIFPFHEPVLKLKKIVNQETAQLNDVLTYTLKLSNPKETTTVKNLSLVDTLPEELTYIENSTKLKKNAEKEIPLHDNEHWLAGTFTYALSQFTSDETIEITYQAKVKKKSTFH